MSGLTVPSLYVTLVAFTAIWLLHVRYEDAGLVDYYWGPGFAVIAWLELWLSGTASLARIGFAAVVTLWAARLTIQLVGRHLELREEDGRYATMRRKGGRHWWWRSLYKLFWLQALILWIVATPVHSVGNASADASLGLPGIFGYAMFAAGFAVEVIADAQLARHRHERPDRSVVLDTGLWRFSRHPNYFGEIVLWFGLAIVAWDLSGTLWAFAGPVILALVIRFVSIPITERHAAASRPDYAGYAQRVPALLPLPSHPRTSAAKSLE